MNEPILKAEKLSQQFGNVKVLDALDLEIYHGDFTVIMGASGAGKSTLLYVLSGMDTPSGGTVRFREQELEQMREREMCRLRAREFGFVFQQTRLVSNLTVAENLLVAGYNAGKEKPGEVRARTQKLMERLHIQKIAAHFPNEISGGEAQRAAVARAIINEPQILFADEPTGALNRANTEEILDIFTALHADGQDILMVTHDIKAAVRGTRQIYLEDGRIAGEYRLGEYDDEEREQREELLNEWLKGLSW